MPVGKDVYKTRYHKGQCFILFTLVLQSCLLPTLTRNLSDLIRKPTMMAGIKSEEPVAVRPKFVPAVVIHCDLDLKRNCARYSSLNIPDTNPVFQAPAAPVPDRCKLIFQGGMRPYQLYHRRPFEHRWEEFKLERADEADWKQIKSPFDIE
ncbi:hypothetical protein QBC40DRAFT_274789 [Triangularia verruculosa]|uniref:Uncharacterized protein n=1 Tax=Triangularia verruculosa TaxID=2587418 RepID=A0AAN7AW40_9PEZI|nr:hypothetical protein QBC40DRAFT_274789 [Triangularia verruculosa]